MPPAAVAGQVQAVHRATLRSVWPLLPGGCSAELVCPGHASCSHHAFMCPAGRGTDRSHMYQAGNTATSLRGLTRNRPRLKMSTFATVGPNKIYGPLTMPTAVSFLTTEQKSSMWKTTSIWPEIRYRYEYGVCLWAPCTRQCKACFG